MRSIYAKFTFNHLREKLSNFMWDRTISNRQRRKLMDLFTDAGTRVGVQILRSLK